MNINISSSLLLLVDHYHTLSTYLHSPSTYNTYPYNTSILLPITFSHIHNHGHEHCTTKMDEPSYDRDNPAKRRCPNDRESDALFMTRSPEPTTSKESPDAGEALDDAEDNDSDDNDDDDDDDNPGLELGESTYDESQELFPAHPAFDPAIELDKDRAESSVKRLGSVLEELAHVNKDLENMKEKTAGVMKSGSPRQMRVGLLGGTAASK